MSIIDLFRNNVFYYIDAIIILCLFNPCTPVPISINGFRGILAASIPFCSFDYAFNCQLGYLLHLYVFV
jgi:hypothetical protein